MIATYIDEPICRTALSHPLATRFVLPLARQRMGRAFDDHCEEKCLLLYQDDRLAEPQFAPFARHIGSFHQNGISVRACPAGGDASQLIGAATTIMYQPSFDEYFDINVDAVKRLRRMNPNAWIVFCDWFAPCDIRFAERVDPYVDAYAKKALMQDRQAYLGDLKSHTNLMDFYSKFFEIDFAVRTWQNPETILPKLRLTPAFCTSSQLYHRFSGDQTLANGRDIDVHARIQTKGEGWYGDMRQFSFDAVTKIHDFKMATDGMVKKSQFMQELSRSRLCFSPFGYGELCWRDFEAFAVGAVLIKPDMSHLDVMGDVFRPWETYIPVSWDFSDLDTVIEDALSNLSRLDAIAANAYHAVQDTLGFASTLEYMRSLTRRG